MSHLILPRARSDQRGFTLVELVVVVVIIGVVAALAVPLATRQMKERRAMQAAQQISDMYRSARMRALGRGSSVLVRFQNQFDYSQGGLQVWESIAPGRAVGCTKAPGAGCTANVWPAPASLADTGSAQLLNNFNVAGRGEFEGVEITMRPAGGADTDSVAFMDVCFTPMGTTYMRTAEATALTPMVGTPVAQVTRQGTAGQRDVLILANGAARVKGREVVEAE